MGDPLTFLWWVNQGSSNNVSSGKNKNKNSRSIKMSLIKIFEDNKEQNVAHIVDLNGVYFIRIQRCRIIWQSLQSHWAVLFTIVYVVPQICIQRRDD